MAPKSVLNEEAGPSANGNTDVSGNLHSDPNRSGSNSNSNSNSFDYGSIASANGANGATHASANGADGMKQPPTGPSKSVSYWDFLRQNRSYRIFMASYMITMVGEWLTYVASITFIEERLNHQSRTAISYLILIRFIPSVLFSSLGGTLADLVDRRKLMVLLDACGALTALLFIAAYRMESVGMLYAVTFLQNSIAGLYAPCWWSLLPMLIPAKGEHLQKANVISEVSWSMTMSFGSAFGGYVAGTFGSNVCFLLDSFTYLSSACLLLCIPGNFKASEVYDDDESKKALLNGGSHNDVDGDGDVIVSSGKQSEDSASAAAEKAPIAMALECMNYLYNSYFGLLVFMKPSACLVYGAVDIVNVAISEEDPTANASQRLGLIFACVGCGGLVGPILFELFTGMDRPWTIQLACIASFGLMGIGIGGWVLFDAFWVQCIFAVVRVVGTATIYADSNMMLQRFTKPTMLGRVMGVMYGSSLLSKATSAYLCGYIMDLDPEFFTIKVMSTILAGMSFFLTAFWSCYHISGRGGAHPDALKLDQEQRANEAAAALKKEESGTPSISGEQAKLLDLPEVA